MDLDCYGNVCGGSRSGSSAHFCTDMLIVWLEEVLNVSETVSSYAHMLPIWVKRVVAIVISINNEVFPYFVECLCGDVGRGVISKWDISGKEVF